MIVVGPSPVGGVHGVRVVVLEGHESSPPHHPMNIRPPHNPWLVSRQLHSHQRT